MTDTAVSICAYCADQAYTADYALPTPELGNMHYLEELILNKKSPNFLSTTVSQDKYIPLMA